MVPLQVGRRMTGRELDREHDSTKRSRRHSVWAATTATTLRVTRSSGAARDGCTAVEDEGAPAHRERHDQFGASAQTSVDLHGPSSDSLDHAEPKTATLTIGLLLPSRSPRRRR